VTISNVQRLCDKVIITDHFCGPGRAIGPVCMCPNDNFELIDLDIDGMSRFFYGVDQKVTSLLFLVKLSRIKRSCVTLSITQ